MKFKLILLFLIFIFFGCEKKNEYKKVGDIIQIPVTKLNQYINDFKTENKSFYPWSSLDFIKIEKLITIPDYNNDISLKNIFDNNVNTCWISEGTNLNTYEKIKLFYHTKGKNIKKSGTFIFEKILFLSGLKNNQIKSGKYCRIKKLAFKQTIKWIADNDFDEEYTEFTLQDSTNFQVLNWNGSLDAGYPSAKDDEYITEIEIQIKDIYQGKKYKNIIFSEIIFLGTLLQPPEEGGY